MRIFIAFLICLSVLLSSCNQSTYVSADESGEYSLDINSDEISEISYKTESSEEISEFPEESSKEESVYEEISEESSACEPDAIELYRLAEEKIGQIKNFNSLAVSEIKLFSSASDAALVEFEIAFSASVDLSEDNEKIELKITLSSDGMSNNVSLDYDNGMCYYRDNAVRLCHEMSLDEFFCVSGMATETECEMFSPENFCSLTFDGSTFTLSDITENTKQMFMSAYSIDILPVNQLVSVSHSITLNEDIPIRSLTECMFTMQNGFFYTVTQKTEYSDFGSAIIDFFHDDSYVYGDIGKII